MVDVGACEVWYEKLFFVLLFLALIVAFVTAIKVYSNESDELKSRPVFREMLGGVDVFFTGKYLNSTGKKWRIPYVISVYYILFFGVYSSFYSSC